MPRATPEHKYWAECVSASVEEHGVTATPEQIASITNDVRLGHENYGMAFYSPPSSDRLAVIEGEWKAKYERLQREFDTYRSNAETAVKKALGQYEDSRVSIASDGEVFRHGGRTERIQ